MSCRSSSTCSPARCRSSGRGRASTTRPRVRRAPLRAVPAAARAHGPLAGHGACPLDVRRGTRHGRRLRPRLVAEPRPSADPQDAALPARECERPHEAVDLPARSLRRAGRDRRRRPRLLGPEPDPQPERARRRRPPLDLRPRPVAARHVRPPVPDASAARATSRTCSPIPSSTRSRSPRRSRRTTRSGSPRLQAGKHVFIEKPLAGSVVGGARARERRERARR